MKSVTIASGQLAVVDQGQGPPLLLVHGFPLDHTLWQNQIEPLAANYRVIAPDLRGIGQSSAVSAAPLTMAAFADDLANLLDAIEVREPIHYCGLSMGGYIAWEFWRRHPQRLRSLILCDTKAAADTPETAATREQWAVDVLRSGTTVVEQAILPKLMAPATYQQQPAVGEQVRRMLLDTRPETFAAGQRGMALRIDMRPYLGEIRLPTLLIVGSEDAISPPQEMHAMAEAIAGSRLITIPKVGHLTSLEAPDEFTAAVLEFLAEQG
ncbi:MAG: alpha/beta hydrolase [Planctomycetes bacterium]|nr:alpha/beta hydrolase [Planctomycetota bacterium]